MSKDIPYLFHELQEDGETANVMKPQNNHGFFIGVSIVFFLTIVLVYYLFGFSGASEKPMAEVSIVQDVSPTTIVPSLYKNIIDLSEYAILVQNVSGETGADGRVRDLLEGEGFGKFILEDTEADDFEGIRLKRKPIVSDAVGMRIQKVLEEAYTITEEEEMPDSGQYDIILVVGRRRGY